MIDKSMNTYACNTATTMCSPLKMMGMPIGIMEKKTRVIKSPAKIFAQQCGLFELLSGSGYGLGSPGKDLK